ncbi:unnamed protein product [Vitrella brassicaformis CCMP3155]|uniref:Metal-dependent protein hydrolase n=1 Tax=Vitrella brassicaformis (strain CCMP3155) TaxID=1169540 RepID=A0A0G4G4Y3_VITBC|nr:unnamed protein product [Vitrella brassicaformis CCMP3155]|eukprot:CEM23379.1 unnamed protein product [Vitrella brassicaformis CCMP3155]
MFCKVPTPIASIFGLSTRTPPPSPDEVAAGEQLKLIGTHDGVFHCDEVLACALLRLLPEYESAAVIRSRNPAYLDKAHTVVDVGGVYDAAARRFDHHQAGFADVLGGGFETKLSSAGLVYKHYGRRVIETIVGPQAAAAAIDVMYKKIYQSFVEAIDGIDNGIEVADGPLRYKVYTQLSGRVGQMNPRWNQEQSPGQSNAAFKRAMRLAGEEFVSSVVDLWDSWWPAREIVKLAYGNRHNVHSSGQIVLLERFCPWASHLFDIEQQQQQQQQQGGSSSVPPVVYVIYADVKGSWRVHAVAEEEGSFTSRKALPEQWRGLGDEELSRVMGIEGGVFVHGTGFIGGHATKEGAMKMAEKALAA